MAVNGKWMQGVQKGGFHKTLGKPANAPITAADIAKGRKMGGKAAKQANLAATFKKIGAKRAKGGK
jgi:hypothetical protein